MYQEDLSYGLFLSDRQLDFLSNYPQGFDRMKCFSTFLQLAVKEPTHYEKKEYFVDLPQVSLPFRKWNLPSSGNATARLPPRWLTCFMRWDWYHPYRIAVPQSSQSIVLPVGISAIRLFAMRITHAILRSSSASRLTTNARMLPMELLLKVVLPMDSLPIKMLQKIA